MATVLVDTNVLVYAHDPTGRAKYERAIEVLKALEDAQAGCFSAQNLSEFFWVTTRGRRPLLTVAHARAQIERFTMSWRILEITGMIVLEAVTGVSAHRLSFWDALLWAAARLNQVPIVLSEDFADGSRVGGIRFVNPFAPAFKLGRILSR